VSAVAVALRTRRRLRGRAAVGAAILVILVLVALLAPVLAPHDPNAIDPSRVLAGPDASHPFGSDALGRDVLSRVLFAYRVSLGVAVGSVLVAMAVGASLIALIGQRNLNALQSVAALPMSTRLANAIDGYIRYIGKLFWPSHLAIPYPMVEVPSTTVILGALALIAVTALAWWLRNRAPYVLAGWLWFLGTLVPVIGIIQIGPQSIADRYTYFSYVGLFIAIVWSIVSAFL